MESIVAQAMTRNNWSKDYANKVLFEYKRFLKLRHKYKNVSPSNDVDELWHQHILNVKNYCNYCVVIFGDIIDHNPADAYNQVERQERIKNTIKHYVTEFGEIQNKAILGIPETKNADGKKIKVAIVYVFDVFENGKFVGKRWKPNKFPYDKKILTYTISETDTTDTLKTLIQNVTQHSKIAMRVYKNRSDYEGKDIGVRNDISNGKIVDIAKDVEMLYVVLEEMSSMGYC